MAKKRKKRKAAKTTKTTVSNNKKQTNSKNNARPPKTAQRGTNKSNSGKSGQGSTRKQTAKKNDLTKKHPKFPFWARLRLGKWRTTLVIDEEIALNNKTNKVEEQFVHREATSPTEDEKRNKKYERISPNPDKDKAKEGIDMLLKRPTKHSKHKFEIHNKNLEMPQHLKDKYDKNNKKE